MAKVNNVYDGEINNHNKNSKIVNRSIDSNSKDTKRSLLLSIVINDLDKSYDSKSIAENVEGYLNSILNSKCTVSIKYDIEWK